MFLALPSIASAQWYPGGNGGYGNGGYGNGSYNRNIRGTLQNLKNRARNFETATNRAEDHQDDRDDDRWGNRNGGYGNRNGGWGNRNGNWNRGDYSRLEDLADNFKKATDRLEDAYGNGRNLNRSRDEANRVLSIASQIENELRNVRGNRNLERQWSQMRNDLHMISNVYGGYYGNGGYNNRNGDWRNRIPFPF